MELWKPFLKTKEDEISCQESACFTDHKVCQPLKEIKSQTPIISLLKKLTLSLETASKHSKVAFAFFISSSVASQKMRMSSSNLWWLMERSSVATQKWAQHSLQLLSSCWEPPYWIGQRGRGTRGHLDTNPFEWERSLLRGPIDNVKCQHV